MAVEIAQHVPRLADKRKLDPALLLAALQVMPIEWKPASVYEDHREQAESRVAARDPDDWPWEDLPNRRACRIGDYKRGYAIEQRERFDEYVEWFIDAGKQLRDALIDVWSRP